VGVGVGPRHAALARPRHARTRPAAQGSVGTALVPDKPATCLTPAPEGRCLPGASQYQHDSDVLVEGLEGNTRRYAKLLADAADFVMPEPTVELTQLDVLDVLYQEARPRPPGCSTAL